MFLGWESDGFGGSGGGATPLLLPMRFPGQYYDQETDLVENWNRFYDPNTGRYFEPEPAQLNPDNFLIAAQFGMFVPAYAYANDNPIAFTDSEGLSTTEAAQRCAAAQAQLDRCTRKRDKTIERSGGCPDEGHQQKIDEANRCIQNAQKKIDFWCNKVPPPVVIPVIE
jgi:RHS repeat-associated protein